MTIVLGEKTFNQCTCRHVSHTRPCPWCGGTGKRTHKIDLGDASGEHCSLCEGSGKTDRCAGNGVTYAVRDKKRAPVWVCPDCNPDHPNGLKFVAVGHAVMQGERHIATATSHTMAKRMANALNRHKPNREGV